jgi:hypothetical protein
VGPDGHASCRTGGAGQLCARIYQPQPADVARYRTGFALYRDLYMRLQTFLPQLGKFDEGDENGQ